MENEEFVVNLFPCKVLMGTKRLNGAIKPDQLKIIMLRKHAKADAQKKLILTTLGTKRQENLFKKIYV